MNERDPLLAIPTPKVGIVLVNWRDCEPTSRCVAAIYGLRYDNWICTIVDSESTHGSWSALNVLCADRVHLVRSEPNLGWAGGCNAGAEHAWLEGCDLVWLLNNDAIPEPESLGALVGAVGRHPSGFAAFAALPTLIDSTNPFWIYDLSEQTGLPDATTAYRAELQDQFGIIPSAFVSGFAMLIPRSVWNAVGKFDERLFLYYEDVDWCMRAARKGLKCAYVAGARVAHEGGVSTGGPDRPLQRYFGVRNRLVLGRRYADPVRQMPRLYREAYWALSDAARGDGFPSLTFRALYGPRTRAVMIALRDFLLRRYGDCPAIIRSLHEHTTRRN